MHGMERKPRGAKVQEPRPMRLALGTHLLSKRWVCKEVPTHILFQVY